MSTVFFEIDALPIIHHLFLLDALSDILSVMMWGCALVEVWLDNWLDVMSGVMMDSELVVLSVSLWLVNASGGGLAS